MVFRPFIGHQQTNTTLFLLEQSFPIFMIIDVTAPYFHRSVNTSHSLFNEKTFVKRRVLRGAWRKTKSSIVQFDRGVIKWSALIYKIPVV